MPRPGFCNQSRMLLLMNTIVLWHNPRCSKSREALELLRSHGIEPIVRDYLETPPTESELRHVIDLLGVSPRDIARIDGEMSDVDAVLRGSAPDADAVIALLLAHPQLIQRPIVIMDNRAVIGRPPERVLELLQSDKPEKR